MSARRKPKRVARRPHAGGTEPWQVELRQAVATYRSLFDHSAVGIYRVTPGKELVGVNPALTRLLGYQSPEDVLRAVRQGKRLVADPSRAAAFWEQMERRGLVEDFDIEYIRQDGSPAWGRVSAWAVPGEDGQVLYYEGTVQDVSQRWMAEAALRESEHRYRDLFEHNPMPMHVVEPRVVASYLKPEPPEQVP